MVGRPKSKARRRAEERWFSRGSSGGRPFHLDRGVIEWLRTGRGFVHGAGYTNRGSPERNRQDLDRAIASHLADESKYRKHSQRFGMDTKFATRDRTADGQAFWLWLTTSTGRGSYPRGTIVITVDHG